MIKQILKAYFFIFFSLAIFSCQKTDRSSSSDSLNQKQLQEKIAKAKAWMATQPKMIIHQLSPTIGKFPGR